MGHNPGTHANILHQRRAQLSSSCAALLAATARPTRNNASFSFDGATAAVAQRVPTGLGQPMLRLRVLG